MLNALPLATEVETVTDSTPLASMAPIVVTLVFELKVTASLVLPPFGMATVIAP